MTKNFALHENRRVALLLIAATLCTAGISQVTGIRSAAARAPLEPGQIAAKIASTYVGLHMGVASRPDPAEPTWAEWWCADFVKYVWDKAGADTTDLTSSANSFIYDYAPRVHTVPRVGDAVLVVIGKNWTDPDPENIGHVALVTAVNGDQITSVGGDEGNGTWTQNYVKRQTTGAAPGSVFDHELFEGEWQDIYVFGYVSPKFTRIPGPDFESTHY